MQAAFEKVVTPTEASFLCRVRRDSRFEFHWHSHPEYEITLIDRSRGRRLVGDSIADYGDEDLVLVGPDLPHTWFTDPAQPRCGPHVAIYVQFLPTFLGEGFLERPELRGVAQLLRRASRGVSFPGRGRERAIRGLREMVGLDEGMPRLIALLAVLDELARCPETEVLASPTFVPVLDQGSRRRVDAVCRYLNENYTGRVSQAEAARLAHLNPSAFSRFFRRATGRTFVAYLNELRVGRACQLLIESDLPVTKVCYASGFTNLANFNRRFLDRKGMSPRAYRRLFTGGS